MSQRIYLSPPHMGSDEIKLVQEVFESNWISPAGPQLDLFEKELAEYVGVPHSVALSSGTAAIHLALILLDVKAGDEVVSQSFTFAGSANPIVYQGATPVFVDSESDTWNMDPSLLEDALKARIRKGSKPKAIIVVDLYGVPAKLDELLKIAARFEIPVIEDAAEALGSRYHEKAAGTWGEIGIYSFNGNKIMTASTGGAMIGSKERMAKAKFLSTQARDPAPHYQHSAIGYNYRLSGVCAAIGRGQLRVMEERVQQRRRNFEFYKNFFRNDGRLSFPAEPAGTFCNRWLTTILTKHPEKIRLALERENIESRPLWKPMHLQPIFKDAPFYGSDVSQNLFEQGLCLPSGSALTEAELERIATLISKTPGV